MLFMKFFGLTSLNKLLTLIKDNFFRKSETVECVLTNIPTELSELNDDSTHRLVTDAEKEAWNSRGTINDGQLTMQVNGTQKATFTANQAGNSTFNVTASDLGLSQALVFKGVTTTDLTDEATTSPISMDDGTSLTPEIGNVVITKSTVATNPNTEFVWASGKWNKLGDAKSYALSSITVTGTGALSGGGNLTSNRTITHSAGSAASKASGLYKFSTDAYSHVNSVTAVAKSDITALGIPAQDTTYTEATTSASGLMSSSDKTKLDGVEAHANNYSLPIASASTLGGIKVGTNLSIDENGVLSASGGSAGVLSFGGKTGDIVLGTNLSMSGNTVNATDTTYTAGTGISIVNNVISVNLPNAEDSSF